VVAHRVAGLDARAAAVVMGVVRTIADSGRTVVCTIHQPSAAIFASFDDLLLLRRGGAVVYNGAAAGVVPYLSRYAPAPAAGRNPAGWMLEVVAALAPGSRAGMGAGEAPPDAAAAAAAVDLAEEYERSGMVEAAARRASEAAASAAAAAGSEQTPRDEEAAARAWDEVEAAGSSAQPCSGAAAPGAWVQFSALLQRNLLGYWRNPGHNIPRYLITLAMALLIGTVEFGKSRCGQEAHRRYAFTSHTCPISVWCSAEQVELWWGQSRKRGWVLMFCIGTVGNCSGACCSDGRSLILAKC
jgi:hypothetical protein